MERSILYKSFRAKTAFLQLLAILLIGANVIGALAALWAGNYTSRKMLSPINQMIGATNQIGGSSLGTRPSRYPNRTTS